MSWTVACFCGHVYTMPPDRCPTCGETLPDGIGPRRAELSGRVPQTVPVGRVVEVVRA